MFFTSCIHVNQSEQNLGQVDHNKISVTVVPVPNHCKTVPVPFTFQGHDHANIQPIQILPPFQSQQFVPHMRGNFVPVHPFRQPTQVPFPEVEVQPDAPFFEIEEVNRYSNSTKHLKVFES